MSRFLSIYPSGLPCKTSNPIYNRSTMQKKTCKTCGKTWLIERFDDHLCTAIPKKARKVRVTAGSQETQSETENEGSPLVSFRRML